MNKIYLIIPVAILLLGCPQPSSGSKTDKPNKDYYQSFEVTNDSGANRQALLLLTNSGSSDTEIPLVTVSGRAVTKSSRTTTRMINPGKNKLSMSFQDVSGKPNSRSVFTDPYASDIVGNTRNFWLTTWEGNLYQQEFSLKSREVLDIVSGGDLFIWLDSRITNNQAAIDYINSQFQNIYSDMNDLFGEPWGTNDGYQLRALSDDPILPANNRNIHIILTDIDNDKNRGGFVGGYQWAYKDAFKHSNKSDYDTTNVSNQCHNLVMDVYDYFNLGTGDSWNSQDFNTASFITTLIHEYQHLIHFYQKDVLNGVFGDSFINEMMSMTAEDMLAYKYANFKEDFDNKGLKEYTLTTDFGRVGGFNLFWDEQSAFNWDNRIVDSYSTSYVFGAYLARNYGFALFKDYFNHSLTGITGVISSLNKTEGTSYTINNILNNFGTAVLLSDIINNEKGYRLNASSNFEIEGHKLKPLNLYNTYYYYFDSDRTNRLLKNSYSAGTEGGYPLNLLNMEILKELSKSLGDEFLKESNLYIDLGVVEKGAEVKIYTFSQDTTYQILWN